MLKNYATFLGLDPEPLLLRFAEGLQARLVVNQASRSQAAPRSEAKPSSRSPLRRLLSADLIIGGVLALFWPGSSSGEQIEYSPCAPNRKPP